MANLALGTHEFKPDEMIGLIRQYDFFILSFGDDPLLQIRVPTRWIRLEMANNGVSYLTCRDKRKRDGHLFKISANKFVFDVDHNSGRLSGNFKSDLNETNLYVVMWGSSDVPADDDE